MTALDIPSPPEWMADGSCVQTGVGYADSFFPEKGGATREAKSVCEGCPVTGECLEYALVNGERFGVWGGASERERRAISAERADPEQTRPIRHGRGGGSAAHRRRGEKPCPICMEAETMAAARRRAVAC